MSFLIVPINISREEYLSWYDGSANAVSACSIDGVTVNFPVNILRPFITHSGVDGTFAIYFDDNNKFLDIKRLR